ncbi:TolB family protein [Clostridium sp.]|uniref:TolB family protein n=1 Tax=Clostridium sp. TaxID=1506 RepID=UPI003D6D1824
MIKNSKKLLTLTTALVMTIAGTFIGSVLAKTKENKNLNDFAVMVKDNSLWAANLSKSDKEVVVDKGVAFENLSISPDGLNVAYIKDGSFFIAEIDLIAGQKKPIKVVDKVVSYTWGKNTDLAYAEEKGGLNGFNLTTKTSSIYIKSEDRYEEMESDGKGNIYASVYKYFTKAGYNYVNSKGLIKYDMSSGVESLIIKAKPWSDDIPGSSLVPKVAGISKDGAYVYIWRKAQSGSMNADGVRFGVYEVKTNKFILCDDKQVFALAYSDNLAINPLDGKKPVLNNGGVRNMNVNKTIGTVDIIKGTFAPILPESMISTTKDPYNTSAKGMVTMTPAFSPDGKKVIYSASSANDDAAQWAKEPHNIYTVDLKTKKVEKITKGDNFGFAPNYILKGAGIIFARKTGDSIISLFRLKGNKEECIAKDIKLQEDSWYYGHYNLEDSLDIYTN